MKPLSVAIAELGPEVTADRAALSTLSDAAADADSMPVDRVRLLNGFNGLAVSLWGFPHNHTAPRTCRICKTSNALDEPDARLAMNAFNNCAACHILC